MGKYVTKSEFVEFKAEMMNTVKSAIAEALAPAKKGNGKSGNEGSNAQTQAQRKEAQKQAFERMQAEFAEKQANYKPSASLKKAIKADRTAITWAIAKEKYGFVGTKKSLQALKDELCK